MNATRRLLSAPAVALLVLAGLAVAAGPALAASPPLPPGVKLPAGVDVNQFLQQMSGGKTPPTAQNVQDGNGRGQPSQTSAPAFEPQVDPKTRILRLAQDLLWDGRLTDEREKRLDQEAESLGLTRAEAREIYSPVLEERAALVRSVLVQAQALADKGDLAATDRSYLERRLQDRGVEKSDAERVVAHVADRLRNEALYGSYVRAFLEDGLIDRTEQGMLAKKRAALGLTKAEHDEVVAAVREKLREPAQDVLGDIRDRDRDLEQEQPDLELYGRGLFGRKPDQAFEPPANLPPPDDYRIGPGDRFRVALWGRLEAEYTLEVDPEGRVLFPKIGPVRVGGLTYAEARDLLTRRAESITGVTAAVTLDGTRSVRVFVVGELMKPGSVTLSPLSTVVHAVMAAEGPTPLGSLRHVVLRRAGAQLAVFDLYGFLLRGEMAGSRPLQDGDVVVVPRAERTVAVWGKVKRPAVYELVPGEGLRAALAYAGGLAADAFGGRVQVVRTVGHERRVALDVSLPDLDGDFPLEDGDRVRVYPLPPEVDNRVSLFGHVYQTGTFAWTDGMRVSDLVGGADNLKPEVDLAYAVILRETGPDRSKKVVAFHLGKALDGSGPGEDPALRPRDEVYVFSRDQFRPPLRAEAAGEVRNPGLYRFEPGARVADLVRLAGGLAPDALLARAELLRYQDDRTRETLYVDLGRALDGDPAENLELADQDRLVVHPVWDTSFRETVTVDGEVQRPGEIELTRGMTVRDLVFKAGGVTRDAYAGVAHLYRTDRATKEVTIHTFDLGKALAGDPAENLALQDLDRVTIHSAYEFAFRQKVYAGGFVNSPGEFPYATNMRVRDLVLAARGLKEEAYLGQAELVRRVVPGGEEARTFTLTFDLGKALAGDPSDNLPLEPYDRLFVKRIPEWRETWKIELKGEVRFPGVYYVTKGERLSSVIQRAGGYTAEAYLRGAVFTRLSAQELQQRRLDALRDRVQENMLRLSSFQAQAALSPEDAVAQQQYLAAQKQLFEKLSKVRATGRVVIQLAPLEAFAGSEADLAVEDGDALFVPPTPQTVSVVGQVYNPTSLVWEPSNKEAGYYLDRTGGPTPAAEAGEIYVVRADGTVVSPESASGGWWSQGVLGLDLYPGDAILVPDKVVQVSALKLTKDVSQILFQIAVTAGVAIALF